MKDNVNIEDNVVMNMNNIIIRKDQYSYNNIIITENHEGKRLNTINNINNTTNNTCSNKLCKLFIKQ